MATSQLISFLITHFNRPKSLEQCVASIKQHTTNIPFEIVVSDDCSRHENLDQIKNIPVIRIIESNQNQGLASNINKGIAACNGDIIVYIQEDFRLNENFRSHFPYILQALNTNQVDMVRLRSNVRFLKWTALNDKIKVIPRFSIVDFKRSPYRYSDHPYVVKRIFYNSFGLYLSGVNTSYGENEYVVRMLKLNPIIGLVNKFCVDEIDEEGSVREEKVGKVLKPTKSFIKPIKQMLVAARYYLEAILYNKENRKLLTFKNIRK